MAATERLVEHVAELRRRTANRREIHRTLAAHGLNVSTSGVPEDAEITIDGVLESIADGVVVDATVVAPWTGECRRCLTDIEGMVNVEIREIFETHPTEGETWPLLGDELDLAPMLRDTVLLALPLAPLCSQDCRGPAPEMFPAGTSGDDVRASSGPPGEVRDPRWAALDELRSD